MRHRWSPMLPALLGACACPPESASESTQPTIASPPSQVSVEPAHHLRDVMVDGWQPAGLEQAIALLDTRDELTWEDHGRPLRIPRHPAEKYLADWVIVLDPGHGGKSHVAGYKRGPTGVREAEMNLRVAKLLRRLLEDAGATVLLTREGETSAAADDRLEDTHKRRAEIANRAPRPDGGVGADLFISLHHNAASKPTANYPSIWFHGEADWSEVALDSALAVGHRIGAELRNSGTGITSVLMSDQQMYRRGFAVLRHARVPAFLVESSFFTHPEEEQRLRDSLHNLREAYAIYLGLVESAYGGRPTQSTPSIKLSNGRLEVSTVLDDGLPSWWGSDRQRILSSTMTVTCDGERMDVAFDSATRELTANADGIAEGDHILSIHHANLYKHHNWPQRYRIRITSEGQIEIQSSHAPFAGEDRP